MTGRLAAAMLWVFLLALIPAATDRTILAPRGLDFELASWYPICSEPCIEAARGAAGRVPEPCARWPYGVAVLPPVIGLGIGLLRGRLSLSARVSLAIPAVVASLWLVPWLDGWRAVYVLGHVPSDIRLGRMRVLEESTFDKLSRLVHLRQMCEVWTPVWIALALVLVAAAIERLVLDRLGRRRVA